MKSASTDSMWATMLLITLMVLIGTVVYTFYLIDEVTGLEAKLKLADPRHGKPGNPDGTGGAGGIGDCDCVLGSNVVITTRDQLCPR